MATMSWTYDAPAGVYKNRALSAELRMAAIAETKFMQFVGAQDGLGRKKGEQVTITRMSNLSVPADDSLLELERIPEDDFSLSTQVIAVAEHGRAVPYTSLLEELSVFNIENAVQKVLRNQMALTFDSQAAAAFKRGQIKAIPTGVAELTFDTDGTVSFQAQANLNQYHVEQIRDYMFSTMLLPAYSGGNYIALVSNKAARGIKRDPNFEKWHVYADPGVKASGEIGRIEGVRFFEIQNSAALSNSLGLNGVLGEAIFFGEDAVTMATVVEPELRAKESEDYGRSKGVAWYGVYGFGQIYGDSANPGEARVVHVTST